MCVVDASDDLTSPKIRPIYGSCAVANGSKRGSARIKESEPHKSEHRHALVVSTLKGSWPIILDLGYQTDPASGLRKRKQQWVTFRGTRKEAEGKLADLVRGVNRNEYVEPSKMTLGEWLTEWLEKAISHLLGIGNLQHAQARCRTAIQELVSCDGSGCSGRKARIA
jgi:hypothetical protein